MDGEPVTGADPNHPTYRPAHADAAADVIELGTPTPQTTRVVLERDLSPFDRLAPDARRRLLVRVLCELVAYDAPEEPAARLAG
jgi:hypothetical protein